MVLKRDQVAELQRRADAVKRCRSDLQHAGKAHAATRASLAASQAKVAQLEARLGQGSFKPEHLRAADAGWVLQRPKVQRVASAGAKAKRTSLATLLEGRRATVVSYWATWCKPCTSPEELELLASLKRQLAPYDAHVLSFAIDGLDKITGDSRAATWFYPLHQLDNGHLETLPEGLVKRTGLGLPLFVVVGPKGRVAWLRKGRLEPDVVSELVTAAARMGRESSGRRAP